MPAVPQRRTPVQCSRRWLAGVGKEEGCRAGQRIQRARREEEEEPKPRCSTAEPEHASASACTAGGPQKPAIEMSCGTRPAKVVAANTRKRLPPMYLRGRQGARNWPAVCRSAVALGTSAQLGNRTAGSSGRL